ncbi:hypothetical protein N566_11690 [Streptomycetaceae bacterium MP113-05]|nr:hypothetical protein N566_11690 [Streptomycetaceae bacterium MP113-05]
MASTRHAPELTETRRDPRGSGSGPLGDTDPSTAFPPYGTGFATEYGTDFGGGSAVSGAYGPDRNAPYEEWNPTADSVRPVRGRHRVAKQRGMARSSAVLGVGVIAAVGAGGMAGAKEKPAAISVPDLSSVADEVAGKLPSGISALVPGADVADDTATVAAQAPLTQAGFSAEAAPEGGEALRARILEQAAQQQTAADAGTREEAAAAAAEKASEKAGKKAEAERKAAAERKREAEEEARRKAEAARLAELARSYTLPVASYTLSSGFGAGGGMWENDHTGQDFAAQTGTPVRAVHSGTVKEAGWAGSYGYRIVLELGDGTEVWYCHLSSMNVSAGSEVGTKDVIGNVGSTGNSTGPHLHVEVRPGGGTPVDPLSWLRGKGLSV